MRPKSCIAVQPHAFHGPVQTFALRLFVLYMCPVYVTWLKETCSNVRKIEVPILKPS